MVTLQISLKRTNAYFCFTASLSLNVGWLVVLALLDSISVYNGPSPKERKKEKRKDRGEKKMSKQPQPSPTPSALGPCTTIIPIVGHPGTGSLPRNIAPPDYPSRWLVVLGLTAL